MASNLLIPNHMKLISLIALLFIHPYGKALSWNDYTGKPYGDENVLAVTAWNISLKEEWTGKEGWSYDIMSYKALPEFIADKSFTRTSDSAVLVHEQYHYALVELYAAKIQKEISGYFLFKDHKKVERIYDFLCNKLRKMQDLYDMETANSRNKTTQRLWELNIDKEIKRLQ